MAPRSAVTWVGVNRLQGDARNSGEARHRSRQFVEVFPAVRGPAQNHMTRLYPGMDSPETLVPPQELLHRGADARRWVSGWVGRLSGHRLRVARNGRCRSRGAGRLEILFLGRWSWDRGNPLHWLGRGRALRRHLRQYVRRCRARCEREVLQPFHEQFAVNCRQFRHTLQRGRRTRGQVARGDRADQGRDPITHPDADVEPGQGRIASQHLAGQHLAPEVADSISLCPRGGGGQENARQRRGGAHPAGDGRQPDILRSMREGHGTVLHPGGPGAPRRGSPRCTPPLWRRASGKGMTRRPFDRGSLPRGAKDCSR